MRRLKVISLTLIAALALSSGYFLSGRGVYARGVHLNAKDLPEHSLMIIAPTAPSFEAEVGRLAAGLDNKQRHLVKSLKPFSVFIKNRNHREVIAYRLRWDILRPDGVITTHTTTYAEPGALMGRGPRTDGGGGDAGVSIRPNSGRYVSPASSIGESQDTEGSIGGGVGASSATDLARIQQAGAGRDEAALIDSLAAQLAQAESLTVSLDVAVFDDGSFVGPDSLGYFGQLQAAVSAKRDLLQSSLFAVQRDRPVGQVFDDIEAITREPDVELRADSTQDDYYRFYKKAYAAEALRVRGTIGDDRKAMWYLVQPVYRQWPRLRKMR